MSVTYATFIALFPEFTTADSGEQARITEYISNASLEVSPTSWGIKTDMGISYLAAHMLSMADRSKLAGVTNAASGAIQSAKVGKLEVRFAAPLTGAKAFPLFGLSSTNYGMEYARLRSTLSNTPLQI